METGCVLEITNNEKLFWFVYLSFVGFMEDLLYSYLPLETKKRNAQELKNTVRHFSSCNFKKKNNHLYLAKNL